MFRKIRFIFFVPVSPVGWSIISYFLDWGLGCKGRRAENLSARRCKNYFVMKSKPLYDVIYGCPYRIGQGGRAMSLSVSGCACIWHFRSPAVGRIKSCLHSRSDIQTPNLVTNLEEGIQTRRGTGQLTRALTCTIRMYILYRS